jgi:hypothetical protein
MNTYQAITVCFSQGEENYRAARTFDTEVEATADMQEQAGEYQDAGFAMNYNGDTLQYRIEGTNELLAEFSVSQA